ncbi:MAG: penicillin-insensitive murein endopeptidase [Myxococcota bacterium]
MLVGFIFFGFGCWAWGSPASENASVGYTSYGLLFGGTKLPDRGPGFVRARPGESTRFGTDELVGLVGRAAAAVARAYPGSALLRVGDLSGPSGGRHPRHGSHRVGRDVDLIFYVTDAMGRTTRGRGWLAFDRFGVAREPSMDAHDGAIFFFDDARNWHLVRTMVLDPEAHVQWIFVSQGIKARLLAYGAAHESDPEALFRAAWVLHQPLRGNPHADHFHVRIACTTRQKMLGCIDRKPQWPWMRKELEKGTFVADSTLTDRSLTTILVGGEER